MQEKNKNTESVCCKIQGLLTPFALLNTQVNAQYSFEFEALVSIGSAEDDLNAYFGRLFQWNTNDTAAPKVHLEQQSNNIREFSLRIFESWITQNLRTTGLEIENIQACSAQFMSYLEELDIRHIYEVQILLDSFTFYECDWQDFALVSKDKTYLLHLGVSD